VTDTASKWSRLAGFSAWQWRVLLSTPSVLFATWLRLRLRGYRAALAAARPVRPPGLTGQEAQKVARDTAFALAVATKYGPWWPRCLLRSLALAHLLGRRGIAAEVRIGLPVERSTRDSSGAGPDFPAHAWVEFDGVVLNDRDDVASRFTPFEAPPGRL
jgi:hypothetical protein